MSAKVIGQDVLHKEVTKIVQIFKNSNCGIKPHFILTGTSGSGKTMLIESLAIEHTILLIKGHLQKIYNNNTLGARIVNTLIHSYFIKGKLENEQVKEITFQNTLKLESSE